MSQDKIVRAIDAAVDRLVELFEKEPTRFYTENDLVCAFYQLLQTNLESEGCSTQTDSEGHIHQLIHAEYPTPFRCDMKNRTCVVKTHTDRTPKRNKYKRGHYDIVVMNPSFIAGHPYAIIKAQKFDSFLERVIPALNATTPLILYGIEFMFKRDPLKSSRGKDKRKAIDQYIAEVCQDADKLLHSQMMAGFMLNAKILVFIKGTEASIQQILTKALGGRSEVRLSFAD